MVEEALAAAFAFKGFYFIFILFMKVYVQTVYICAALCWLVPFHCVESSLENDLQ